MEYWNIGILEYWNNGILEYWNIGILECRRSAEVEWSNGVEGRCPQRPNWSDGVNSNHRFEFVATNSFYLFRKNKMNFFLEPETINY